MVEWAVRVLVKMNFIVGCVHKPFYAGRCTVLVPANSPNSTLPPRITLVHRHDTPTRLPSSDPLSVAEREGARSLAAFQQRLCCDQVQLSLVARAILVGWRLEELACKRTKLL